MLYLRALKNFLFCFVVLCFLFCFVLCLVLHLNAAQLLIMHLGQDAPLG